MDKKDVKLEVLEVVVTQLKSSGNFAPTHWSNHCGSCGNCGTGGGCGSGNCGN